MRVHGDSTQIPQSFPTARGKGTGIDDRRRLPQSRCTSRNPMAAAARYPGIWTALRALEAEEEWYLENNMVMHADHASDLPSSCTRASPGRFSRWSPDSPKRARVMVATYDRRTNACVNGLDWFNEQAREKARRKKAGDPKWQHPTGDASVSPADDDDAAPGNDSGGAHPHLGQPSRLNELPPFEVSGTPAQAVAMLLGRSGLAAERSNPAATREWYPGAELMELIKFAHREIKGVD
ncbi:hypothetical protein FN846DRAFT_997535 [Sphaerosporella brunnea]|uniref:Uncharacterized protein n=1 Tax=Sphaerosporella brunnea TaxID=1250544 RepID=A0A5J5EHL6_9PEZI|nr:hypothetical protein FN846DRAFT_997535 [Sphaerosporella brunnea]